MHSHHDICTHTILDLPFTQALYFHGEGGITLGVSPKGGTERGEAETMTTNRLIMGAFTLITLITLAFATAN